MVFCIFVEILTKLAKMENLVKADQSPKFEKMSFFVKTLSKSQKMIILHNLPVDSTKK